MATTKITNPDLFDLGSLNTALKLPSGTTAERPTSPSTGEWRYNTTTNLVEYYDGGSWRELVSEDIPPIPSENFNVVLYTGNGGTQSITGVGFQPDFVWLKNRSLGGYAPRIFDSTRGATNRLQTSTTNPNSTDATSITSFDADGFSVGSDPYVNNSGSEFVAWCWKANGGTTVSNGDGATTSTVQANVSAGFSIIKYTGTGSNTSVGHGLGTTPELIFAKNLDDTTNWNSWTPVSTTDSFISLNLSNALATTTGTSGWSSGAPTSSVVNLDGSAWTNQAGSEIIMYAFASKTSFSKMGSYTGNGSATGPTVTTGFEPAFLLVKRTDGVNSWAILDNKRSPSNPRNKEIFANLNDAESTTEAANFFSNGFQIITTANVYNNNGSTYIYMAFASGPSTSSPTLNNSFNTMLYEGTNADLSIGGIGFQPSLVWIKVRDAAREHIWCDSNRGINRELSSSDNQEEELRGVGAFNTQVYTYTDTLVGTNNGFYLDDSTMNYNADGENYVAWVWKATQTPTINTDGSVQSFVTANQAAGFSIVTYIADGASGATIGHGLSQALDMIIIKRRDGGAGFNWIVGHSSLDFTANETLTLDSSTTIATWNYFNATAPTSSVFYLGTGANTSSVNGSGGSYVAWCFHSVAGFSKFGTYTGTGSSNPITGLGFSPNFVMIKSTSSVENWAVFDTSRGENVLYPNSSAAESAFSPFTFDSDGFTVPAASGMTNGSGQTYIYAAFKNNPAQPAVASGYMDYLVVAGGGGSSSDSGGGAGGGAGGLRTSYGDVSGGGASAETHLALSAGTYTITVGAGGAKYDGVTTAQNGSVSSISGAGTVNTVGGGGAGDSLSSPTIYQGANGGSGGGSGNGNANYSRNTGGSGTTGEGFFGGGARDYAVNDDRNSGGGGGGAAEGGSNGRSYLGGNGGNGLMVAIDGTAAVYAGGGGGGCRGNSASNRVGSGGQGGGGRGANSGAGNAATVNTGGGAGGGRSDGANGGSGIVILRLQTSEYSGTTTGSPTVTTVGSETILTYTGSGTYVHS